MLFQMWKLFSERSDFFLRLLWEHIEISLMAIVIAIVVGGVVGILIAEYDRAAKPTLGVINFLYTIPSISMLGFLIPFSGIGNATAIIALTIYALLPMVKNTHTGLANVDAGILEAAKGMGSTRAQILFKIKLPLALPVIMSGIRSMVTMTIALAGIASFIGAGGLGVAIYRGITTNNAAMTMDGSLLIAVLALATDFLLGLVEKRLSRRTSGRKRRRWLVPLIAVVLVAAVGFCALSGVGGQGTIRIATKPMTEQYILGEMLKAVIEQDTDLKVELTQGVGGGTSNIQPAMESGEFDLYPEYTGTGWNQVLKRDGLYSEALFDELQSAYGEAYDMTWTGMFGFNDTYGLVVRREVAEQYGLSTYSDHAAVADRLTFGAEYDFFEREDGYDALCAAYGMSFGRTMDLDIGLKYQALNQNKIDVMVIFTTDGQLSAADAVVLEDDLGFYPSYLCGNVVRNAVLEAHPELREVFDALTGIITDADMAEMNYAVESEGQEPADVAARFLREKGAEMSAEVEFRNIRKSYDGKTVIENLSLAVEKGDFVTIIGSSGCGKTTLLKMVNGLIQPDAGDVFVMGKNIKHEDQVMLRRNIGYAIQGSVLFPHLTVEQNISYVPNLLNKRDRKRTASAVEKWMKIVGLDESIRNRYPAELSGGQQQRVGIARALAASPELLLMDEPFGAVDEITREQLQNELKAIYEKTGITVLFVTHDISEALKLGTKVLVMDRGEIKQYAPPEDILQNPAMDFVRRLVEKERRYCETLQNP